MYTYQDQKLNNMEKTDYNLLLHFNSNIEN